MLNGIILLGGREIPFLHFLQSESEKMKLIPPLQNEQAAS